MKYPNYTHTSQSKPKETLILQIPFKVRKNHGYQLKNVSIYEESKSMVTKAMDNLKQNDGTQMDTKTPK